MLAEAFVPIVTIDIMAIIFILKDEKYFFDNEKSWLVLLVILLPIVGVLYLLTRLKNGWYVGIGVAVLAFTCTGNFNRLSLHFCIKIFGKLGKLL